MKRTTKENKIARLFKLRPELDKTLRAISKKTSINQTRIVELALYEYFAQKSK